MTQLLLYRESPANGGIVLAPPRLARYVARIHDAINSSRTWAEFRVALPPGEYVAIMGYMVQHGASMKGLPAPNAPFNPELLPGYVEGDYPMWLQQEMSNYLDMLVLDVVERVAILESTPANGTYLFIPPAALDQLEQELIELGYELRYASDLQFY
ncbi:MAG: hypothetical protein AAGA68_05375 [Pseudomonadota bacterium]